MIVDFSVTNFRSISDEQVLNFNVEAGRDRLACNYSVYEDGKIAVLRSAAILGANASGKSNFLQGIRALRWLVENSGDRKEGQKMLPYEPYALGVRSESDPVRFDIEFIVPSGARYRYVISFNQERILTETLHTFPKRHKALVFERLENDSWETVKFGGTYKGGSRKIPFFPNNSYLSKAGNTASSPDSIREVYRYFRTMDFVRAGQSVMAVGFHKNEAHLSALSSLISFADTGIENISVEEKENIEEIKLPDDMPDELKEAIFEQNKVKFAFWHRSEDGSLIPFDEHQESDGTIRLFEILPMLLMALAKGGVVVIDELDAHLHSHLIKAVLDLFHDDEINSKGAQIIFTTHDLSILSPEIMRREQILLTSKAQGKTSIVCLDEFDKKLVRPNSPFYSFYNDGRLGAVPRINRAKIREAVLELKNFRPSEAAAEDA
ncbi:AAA family ATPase [Ruegeria sp. SCP11]|uniref:AAA family ATPase n=1 Tax=Ruegeria sp. SCP11 TaxID=3141378 RepID=UPI00333C9A65